MIKSMTGFGQAQGGKPPFKWSVDIRSWNHRFFECSTRLPNVIAALDDKIRDFVHEKVNRGKITLSVSLKSKSASANGLVLDEDKVGFYIRTLKRIQKKHGLKNEPLSVSSLLAIPNLFTVDHKEFTAEQYWLSLKPVLELSVKKLLQTKVTEGAALSKDMKARIDLIESSVDVIDERSKSIPSERQKKLRERIQELVRDTNVDEARFEQEIAVQADRSDVTEELVRLRHHIEFLRNSLSGTGEVGKKLDFIAQEVQREANTIASKSQSSEIAKEVVHIKSELEKIREQVQNIE